MSEEDREHLIKSLGVLVRGFMLYFILKYTSTVFDGTEMWALLLFLSGDSLISIGKAIFKR